MRMNLEHNEGCHSKFGTEAESGVFGVETCIAYTNFQYGRENEQYY